MLRKKKICKGCSTLQFLFGRGLCKKCYCIQHQKPIKKISEKQGEIIAEYKEVRKEFLTKNPYCKAKLQGCLKKANQVHHLKGKNSKEDWLNTEYFLPVCGICHEQIETMGKEVYELGFKIRRI